NDLFNTSRRRFTNFGADFTSDANLQARTRQINLSFTYRFNNTKKEQIKKPVINSEDSGAGF
ncbi:MAG: hypothetical protein ACEQSF_06390, partial [Solirubrobacteraceae bacterium]